MGTLSGKVKTCDTKKVTSLRRRIRSISLLKQKRTNQTKRGKTKQHNDYLPPSPSIRSLSLGSSGLWSCVTSTALMKSSFGSSWIPRTTPESPTWATYIFMPRIMTTLAVVPDVLGRPVIVFGHSAVIRNKNFIFPGINTNTVSQ